MSKIEIHHNDHRKTGRFVVEKDGHRVGELFYEIPGPESFVIDHTEVAEGAGGMGLGKKLVDAAVALAKEQKLKLVPMCSFAAAIIKKNPEYAKMLHENFKTVRDE